MKMIKIFNKKFLWNASLILLIIIFYESVSADIINPEYYTKKCLPGEIEIECRWQTEEPFGPPIYDECAKYRNNPDFRFLEGEGSSYGGRSKYCLKPSLNIYSTALAIKILLQLLLITLLMEIPIFLIFGFRSLKAIFVILLANLISLPLFNLLAYFLAIFLSSLAFARPIVLIIVELLVIIFEAKFIEFNLKDVKLKRVLISSFIANTISAMCGKIALTILIKIIKY